MPPRKKLIEVALPLEAINVASAREKSIRHGHPSTLHLWWARRPLAACRAVIFASLVDDPDDPDALPAFVEACKALPKGKNATLEDTPRQRLFDFIELLVQWESTTDEEVLNTARHLIQVATEGKPPPLLDPFAGGGSIPLEAQRLGLEAHASDLNPVAVMINKALIEIPPRFANQPPVNPRDRERMNSGEGWKGAAGLAADVRYYGEWMRDKAWEKIGHLYPKHNGETVIAWLWARTVKSPNPAVNVHVPLVRSFELSQKKGRRAWVEPQVDPRTQQVSFVVRREQDGADPHTIPDGTVQRRGARCLVSGVPIPLEYIRTEGKAGRMGMQMLAVVTDSDSGRSYHAPTLVQENSALAANPSWQPEGELAKNPRHISPPLYGMATFADLFTKRQLLALTTLSDLIEDVSRRIYEDAVDSGLSTDSRNLREDGVGAKAYSQALTAYLAFAVDKVADRSSTVTQWASNREHAKNVFVRQAISMVWDFAESNVFSDSSGNFLGGIETIFNVLNLFSMSSRGNARQQDATSQLSYAEPLMISTDPPYYDNVPYADLSDFFYVWLRRNLRDIEPTIFSTLLVPKASELVADSVRLGGHDKAMRHFEEGLHQVFAELHRAANSRYPLTVYYAFKQTDVDNEYDDDGEHTEQIVNTGWETILASLIDSRFTISGTWPVRTELARRTRNQGANALASSIVLVCRPRPDDAPTITRRQFLDALRRELPLALKNLQSGNIAPVDLAQASIGPGMAVFSRYARVLEADGSAMTVRVALGLINQELDAYLAEQDGDIDRETRFAVAWFEQFGFGEGEFGQADVLARAKDTAVAGVAEAGIADASKGKVKLAHWSKYDPGAWDPQMDRRPTVWEAVHHLIERLNAHGEDGAALLLTRMPPAMAAEARGLAYRLYNICERKGWAEHARDYNGLVVLWSDIGQRAATIRDQGARGEASQQERLFE